jgi:hypothetical protein
LKIAFVVPGSLILHMAEVIEYNEKIILLRVVKFTIRVTSAFVISLCVCMYDVTREQGTAQKTHLTHFFLNHDQSSLGLHCPA